jgi:hypothetical protein
MVPAGTSAPSTPLPASRDTDAGMTWVFPWLLTLARMGTDAAGSFPSATGNRATRSLTCSGRLRRVDVRRKRFLGLGSKATTLALVVARIWTTHAPTLAPMSMYTMPLESTSFPPAPTSLSVRVSQLSQCPFT